MEGGLGAPTAVEAAAPAWTSARPPGHLLVVKLADLGDALLATPAVGALRQTWPAARVEVLTTPTAVGAFRLAGVPAADIVTAETRVGRGADSRRHLLASVRRGQDGIVLLHHLTTRRGSTRLAGLALASGAPVRIGTAAPGSRRGWFLTHSAPDAGFAGAHEVDAWLAVARRAGATSAPEPPRVAPGEAARAEAARLLVGVAVGRRVALHLGTGPYSPARRWPGAGFAHLAGALVAAGAAVVVVGRLEDDGDGVRPLPGALDLTGATDLPTLAAVLEQMDLFVGSDSGVMHLAAAAGTPVVALFGPSNQTAWGPYAPPGGPRVDARRGALLVGTRGPHRVVGLDLPCRPCLYPSHRLGSPAGCPTRDCLSWLPAAAVTAIVLERLAELPLRLPGEST